MESHATVNVLIYLAAAVLAVPLFRRPGPGAIPGYLVAGAVIGPQALHFAGSGVVMLLFVNC